jgi:hypothetical protein
MIAGAPVGEAMIVIERDSVRVMVFDPDGPRLAPAHDRSR